MIFNINSQEWINNTVGECKKTIMLNMLKNGGQLIAILGDPNGASLKMCVERSIVHYSQEETRKEHIMAIRDFLELKNSFKNHECDNNVNVYKWDCFFPYTMYIFNYFESEKNGYAKIYIWMTNLFETAEKRLGFVISQINDKILFEGYIAQYNAVLKEAKEITQI